MKIAVATFALLVLAFGVEAVAQGSPADKISSYRAQHSQGRVTTDGTLTKIAREQADEMARKETLDHSVLGSFNTRVAPSGAGNAAENIAYGNATFDKTLDQWIRSPGHQKNLLLRGATKVGVASARSPTGRTYWAMVIAGGYNKKPEPKAKKQQKLPKAAKQKSCKSSFMGLCF